MQKILCVLATTTLLLAGISARPQRPAPYKDSTLPIDVRVKDLLSRMTTEEKFRQLFMIPGELPGGTQNENYRAGLFGFQVSAASKKGDAGAQMLDYGVAEDAGTLATKINSIQKYFVEQSRLGIPIIAFDEALHGLVRGGATVFPQAIALAATWDTALMSRVAGAIAEEAQIRGIRQILSPVINIAGDPRWGRVEETYGEDPLLTSEMAVAFVRPFEKAGIITTPKHFIANYGDGGRDSYPIHYSERLLDEIYFPPFRACFDRGGSRSVMTAYNSLDGIPCDANSWLLEKKLKGEWGFSGFVISDANAVGGENVLHFTSPDNAMSAEHAINNGLDVIFQTAFEHTKLFIPHFLDSGISRLRIDDAVSRVLKAKFEIGLFERPYVPENAAGARGMVKAHKTLARLAAEESIVLLKNERGVLPFRSGIRHIAVIGTDAVEGRLGGYSGPGNGKVDMLDGIKERAGSGVTVTYSPGCGRNATSWVVVPESALSGLKGEYFNNLQLSGEPALVRNDRNINFQWTLYGPGRMIQPDYYSARWTGTLTAPGTGEFEIGLDGDDGYRLYLDGRLLIDNWKKQTYSTLLRPFHFVKGRAYAIRVEFFEPAGNAHLKLIWNVNADNDWQARNAVAVANAGKADLAVIVAGITEGEFQDRASLALPGHQEELIRQVAATGKPVVVVLVGGSAITMNSWLDRASSVLAVWYPGEEGGRAVAAVLFGDRDPGGRLPITFPIAEAQLPLVYDHQPTGRGDDYNNLSGLPLFPFGFGLSYTRFEYSGISLDKREMARGDSTMVRCMVKNTGDREGDEVVELYTREMVASIARPVLELKGFKRIHLRPGESREVAFAITPSLLKAPDIDLREVVEPGSYQIMIGSSSRDLRLKENLSVR
ncbi:MAG: glycoside hydrolase family 3 C-terminal domain-containing protein [Bacteroidota bacterium]|nr:glycoside hydrolase family 3 C-terminal domain-containing protein [Bacteroidota bacterium]